MRKSWFPDFGSPSPALPHLAKWEKGRGRRISSAQTARRGLVRTANTGEEIFPPHLTIPLNHAFNKHTASSSASPLFTPGGNHTNANTRRTRQSANRSLAHRRRWIIQDRQDTNLAAGRGVAVREFPVSGGEADYMLFVDRQPLGVVEAKPAGATLSGVAEQSGRYSPACPPASSTTVRPRPSPRIDGVETFFRSLKDPHPARAASLPSTARDPRRVGRRGKFAPRSPARAPAPPPR